MSSSSSLLVASALPSSFFSQLPTPVRRAAGSELVFNGNGARSRPARCGGGSMLLRQLLIVACFAVAALVLASSSLCCSGGAGVLRSDSGRTAGAAANDGHHPEEGYYVGRRRRLLAGGPGSQPPRCRRCGSCSPCYPVPVPVAPAGRVTVTTEYYPVEWSCKCGDRLYTP